MDYSLAPSVELGVKAYAGVEAARSTTPTLRKRLISDHGVAPSLIKYAEEQTVVSLAAVMQAIRDFGLTDHAFTDWGVVSGPRFLGRDPLAKLLDKFHLQGALGASPLITPYLSLHAVSGTISLALKSHGPNLGVGGSAGSMIQALLTGLAMQQEQALPGVWVTASEWDPEPIPDDSSQQPEPVCRAVSLAVVPAAAGLTLRLFPNGDKRECRPPTVAGLVQFLAHSLVTNLLGKWSSPVAGTGRLELMSSAAALFERTSRAA